MQSSLGFWLPDLTLFCHESLEDTDEAVAAGARAVLEMLQNAPPVQTSLPPTLQGETEPTEEEDSETQKAEIAPSPTQTSAPNTLPPSGGKTKQRLWARMLKRDRG